MIFSQKEIYLINANKFIKYIHILHVQYTLHFRYLTKGKHTIEYFRKRTISKLSLFNVDGLNSDTHLMQRDIKRGELLIVFHDTNACLISALAHQIIGRKTAKFYALQLMWILKKSKRRNCTEMYTQYSVK